MERRSHGEPPPPRRAKGLLENGLDDAAWFHIFRSSSHDMPLAAPLVRVRVRDRVRVRVRVRVS